MVCAHELRRLMKDPANKETANLPVYLLGTSGLQRTLNDAGIRCIGVGSDPAESYEKVFI